jgi:dTDP-glucose 4,6-dehydratase
MTSKVWLVTGGAGFIGGNFVLEYAKPEHGVQLIVLDKLTYAGNLDTLSSVVGKDKTLGTVQFFQGDIADAELVSKLLAQFKPSAVINFAAESHVDRSIDAPAEFIQTNVVGTLALLQASLKYFKSLSADSARDFRFLHVSTDEVYGSLGETGKFLETTAYAPNSPYAASKASSDHLVRAFHHTYDLPVLTTNCSNNYGPYQFPEKLIPLMIQKALHAQSLPVYGDGKNVRDWLHVEDHVRAIACVLQSGQVGEVYNVGGDAERSNIEVVHRICDLLDAKQPLSDISSRRNLIKYVADRPGHDRRYAIDSSKLQSQLHWRPQHNFESGLAQTVDWYLNNSAWTLRIQDGSYRGERLGLS